MPPWRNWPRKPRPRPKWTGSHQQKSGLVQLYQNSRGKVAHRHECRGDTRLAEWVFGFKKFLKGEQT